MGDKDKNQLKKKKAKIRIFPIKKKSSSEKDQITKLLTKYDSIDIRNINTFSDCPLSDNTLKGLRDARYETPTEIQKETILLTLRGNDILGAAKTGSGKTLAFLIPILEVLYRQTWTKLDGVGAIIITPTRELAYQIFETLRNIGKYHDFSAALVIGGKDLKFEGTRINQCNILIATPGRLLQHMDENPLFECTNMQVLVLDEADRCLDMGFQDTMNAIIANLPPKRQTLLFSATQTKSVKDLIRLSLKDPSYVSVHEHAQYSTPEKLEQSYLVCELHEKTAMLWSFIRNHLKKKSVVFFSSCKQVKYFYEVFCRMQPGLTLLALYGTLHQLRRMEIYDTFCRKTSAVLFATDLAARGLDFPQVHWVIHADCPEDAETYIHRSGRTARYNLSGNSVLFLLPNEEEGMLEELEKKKIPIEKTEINPNKLQNPVRKMAALLVRDPALKDTAQRALLSYMKAVYLMKNKNIFDVNAIDTESYAKSIGLAVCPRIRFLQRIQKRQAPQPQQQQQQQQQNTRKVFKYDDTDKSDLSDDEQASKNNKTSGISNSNFDIPEGSDDEDILTVKRKDHDIDESLIENITHENGRRKTKKPVSRAALAKKILKKKIIPNKKILFDEEGEMLVSDTREKQSELARKYEEEDAAGIDIEAAKVVLREEDKFDKKRFREKVKAKHKEERRKLKEKKRKELEGKDDFGSDEEEDKSDLSWLPDPEEIYGKKENDTSQQDEKYNNETNQSNEETEDAPVQKSPKRKLKESSFNKIKTKKAKKINDLSTSLSVNEAEELALMLLKK